MANIFHKLHVACCGLSGEGVVMDSAIAAIMGDFDQRLDRPSGNAGFVAGWT